MFIASTTSPSVFVVLSLGAFSGGVVKGVTGFGNAIINLLVWVAFTAAGVNAGPLQLAVLADSFGCIVCSIPLLVMTSACKTADWRLVIAILTFTSAGSPFGVALLAHLAVQWVELSMACVLLMVICFHIKLHETLRNAMRKRLHERRSVRRGTSHIAVVAGDCGAATSSPPATSLTDHEPCLLTVPTSAVDAKIAPSQGSEPFVSGRGSPREYGHQLLSSSSAIKCAQEDTQTMMLTYCCSNDVSCSTGDQWTNALRQCVNAQDEHQPQPRQPKPAAQDCLGAGVAAGPTVGPPNASADAQPLLEPGALSSGAIYPVALQHRASWAGGCEPKRGAPDESASGQGLALGSRMQRWLLRQDWKEVQRILLFGSVGGFTSGIMGGMTGIGGPPLMIMYEKLKVAKEVVRGTNAINNVLQARLVSYIVMGMFKREDVMLYAVTSAMGLVGISMGNSLEGHLGKKGFSRTLIALMIICCLLLFASAAGLKGHAS